MDLTKKVTDRSRMDGRRKGIFVIPTALRRRINETNVHFENTQWEPLEITFTDVWKLSIYKNTNVFNTY